VPAATGDVAYTVSASGNLNAVVTVQVGSQVSGNILSLAADYNTHVTKGQLVARIDPQIFQARVDQANANLNAARASVGNAQAVIGKSQAELSGAKASVADAQANVMKAKVAVDQAKLDLTRKTALASEGILSKQDQDTSQGAYDSAVASLQAAQAQERAAHDNVTAAEAQIEVNRSQLASAAAQVKQATAALQQAEVDLANTYIRAPVDGVVVARQVDVGQTVAASLQAPTLFQIAQDLTKMQVDTNVSEADIGRAQVGQVATFTVDAYPGRTFRGEVAAVRKAPINVSNVITYDVVVTVANADLKLFPGMTANVNILVDRRENVLRVANAALRYRPSGTESPAPGGRHKTREQNVWVLGQDGKPRAVAVQTGLTDGTYTEITGGDLKPGDAVIVAAFAKKDTAAQQKSGTARVPRGPGF
jgi:HlyD family secretion protein